MDRPGWASGWCLSAFCTPITLMIRLVLASGKEKTSAGVSKDSVSLPNSRNWVKQDEVDAGKREDLAAGNS